MKKSIDEYIKAIKSNGMYYTYCTLWDDPKSKKFTVSPNVFSASSKQESKDMFMAKEAKRQKLLTKLQAWQAELKTKHERE